MPPTEITETHRMWARKAVVEAPDQEAQIERVARQIANAEQRGEHRMLTGIRVLRVLEYIYPDAKTMTEDMGRWAVQSYYRPGLVSIRSVALPPEVMG